MPARNGELLYMMSPCDWTAAGTTPGIPGLQAAVRDRPRNVDASQFGLPLPKPTTGSTTTWDGCWLGQGHPWL